MTLLSRLLLTVVLASGFTFFAHAQESPNAQLLGPSWIGQHIDVRGFAISWDGLCLQVAVERNGIERAGGRVWACYAPGMSVPDLGDDVHVQGVVRETRMTRMGPRWRVVPVVQIRVVVSPARK